MPKKVSELKEEFLKEMDKILLPEGFRRKARYQDYDKQVTEKLRHNIHLTFVSHPGIDYSISVHAAVAHEEVQRLLFGWRRDMKPRDIKETATYGHELGQLQGWGYMEWTIDFNTNLNEIATEIYTIIKLVGYQFLEKYSDLSVILEELYSPDGEKWNTDRDGRAELIPVIEAVLGEKEKSVNSFKKFYTELSRSEERRVGKECRSRWSPYH